MQILKNIPQGYRKKQTKLAKAKHEQYQKRINKNKMLKGKKLEEIRRTFNVRKQYRFSCEGGREMKEHSK